jgi:uncharacterized protein YciI
MKRAQLPRAPLLAAFAFAFSIFAPVSATPPGVEQRNPEFDFWLGDWEVTDSQGVVLGWSRVVLQPGGKVIHESWNDVHGDGGDGWLAHQAFGGKWHYAYAGHRGGVRLLNGSKVDSRMVLQGTGNRSAQPRNQWRCVWDPKPDGTVRQTVEQSDDGVRWVRFFDGIYRKLGEGQGLFVVVRKRSTGWVAGKPLHDQPDYAGHIAFERKYSLQGAIRLIGHLGAEGVHFQYIVRAADAEAARRLIGEDPWDKAKIVEIDAVRPYTPFFGQP